MNYRKNLLGLCGLLMVCLATCLVMGGVAEAATADSYEADDSFATAKTIADGEVQSRSIHVESLTIDVDYVSFTLTELSDVVIGTMCAPGQIGFSLYDDAYAHINTSYGWPGEVNLIKESKLAAGTYYIMVESEGYFVTIDSYTLSLDVTPVPSVPTIKTSQSVIIRLSNQGINATSQSFSVRNDSGGTLNYSISDDAAWLSCSPSTGALAMDESDSITIDYDTSLLAEGEYTATISITDSGALNSPQTVTVELFVQPPLLPDSYETDDSFVDANIIVSGDVQTHSIHESGDKDYLTFSVSEKSNITIKNIEPFYPGLPATCCFLYDSSYTQISGSMGMLADYIDYKEWWAVISISGLEAGTYYILVEAGIDPISTMDTVPSYELNLEVTPLPTVPTISAYDALSYESFITQLCEPGDNASSQDFYVTNTTGGTLDYVITDDVDWFSCSPASGTSTGETDTITINYNTSGLAEGEYTATISVTDPLATNSPYTIPVSLYVSSLDIDNYEFDDSFETASSIANNSEQRRSLHAEYDRDYVSFSLNKASDVVIMTNALEWYTILYLFDSSKNIIKVDYMGHSDCTSKIEERLSAGDYYIVVESSGYYEPINTYMLSLSVASSNSDLFWDMGCSVGVGSGGGAVWSFGLLMMLWGFVYFKRRKDLLG